MKTHVIILTLCALIGLIAQRCTTFAPKVIQLPPKLLMAPQSEIHTLQSNQLQRIINCPSSREFITAFNYLRDRSEFRVERFDASRIAKRVASGCNRAAERFIRIANMLVIANLDSASAIKIGSDFALRSTAEALAFMTVFQAAFLKSHLDIDLQSSVRLALSLSTEFEGDVSYVSEDFVALVRFCIASEGLYLSRPRCALLAARVTRFGQGMDAPIAEAYIRMITYLREGAPRLTTGDAMKLSERVVAISPYAVDNFIAAYQFAVDVDGLRLSRRKALNIATDIAAASVFEREI